MKLNKERKGIGVFRNNLNINDKRFCFVFFIFCIQSEKKILLVDDEFEWREGNDEVVRFCIEVVR